MRNGLRHRNIRLVAIHAALVLSVGLVARAEDEKVVALLKTFADEFVAITPGEGKFPASFQMGSADGNLSEQPVHAVKLNRAFAMAKYEVPQNLYQAVMGENPSRWKGPRNSVEMMSWNDANEFCRKITVLLRERKLIAEEDVIRLPSEAEWEYCCRAGTTTRYSFGDAADSAGDEMFDVLLTSFGESKIGVIKVVREATSLGLKEAKDLVESLPKPLKTGLSKEAADKLKDDIVNAGGTCKVRKAILLDRYGWYTGNAAGNDPPVGALKPNPWGLYDMHGYLWELMADGWSDDYSKASADGSILKPDDDGGQIVMRSGSWKDPVEKLTSTARRKYSVTAADDAVGFRCVKARSPSSKD